MDIMEITTMLGTLLGSLTAVGGFGIFMYRKQNRRLKELEVKQAETSVEKAKVETRAEDWHIWKEQCEALSDQNRVLIERNQRLVEMNAEKEDRHQQDIKDWEERFDRQTDRLRDVQRELIAANDREKEHIRREAQLEKERDHYFNWRCFREHGTGKENCARRKPKQKVPIRYVPLDSETCEECDTAREIINVNINENVQ